MFKLKLPDLAATSTRGKLIAAGVVILAIIAATLTGAWYLWGRSPAKIPEKAAPAVRQPDGALTLEKRPDATYRPPHATPKGEKLERAASVTVDPVKGPDSAGKCPPVTVDLSIGRSDDGRRRVTASSPDGTVVKGIDIPIEDAAPPPPPKLWAAGAVVNPFRQTYGAFVDRDLGWFRAGVQVNQASDRGGIETWVKAGVRF